MVLSNKICGEIEFTYRGSRLTIKWEPWRQPKKLEEDRIVKMSRLTNVAVNPKPIKR